MEVRFATRRPPAPRAPLRRMLERPENGVRSRRTDTLTQDEFVGEFGGVRFLEPSL